LQAAENRGQGTGIADGRSFSHTGIGTP
jgi:hypothetical protein